MIRQRLSAEVTPLVGPVELRPCDPNLNWYGDPATWKSGNATIASAQDYKGDKSIVCWFLGPQTAYAWQAFVVQKPLLRIATPEPQGDKKPLPVYDPAEKISIQVAADFKLLDGNL